jgi:thiamine-phosphate pyrophosphorylase
MDKLRSMPLPRLYPIVDSSALTVRGFDLVSASEAMLEGGARILQFRHKGHYSRTVFEQASRIAALCRGANAQFVIDDRADIALLLDAGVHLGQDDLPPADARKILGPHRWIGFSTHNAEQFAAGLDEPADYLAIGPVFATRSKENPDPVLGLDRVRRLYRRTGLPLVAIGGITRDNALDVLAAGADSVAVIHDVLPDDCSFHALRERMEEWQQLVAK